MADDRGPASTRSWRRPPSSTAATPPSWKTSTPAGPPTPARSSPPGAPSSTACTSSADAVARRAAEPGLDAARRRPPARPDWLSALDGMWPAVEAKLAKADRRGQAAPRPPRRTTVRAATLDSLRAIMMIRAYRIRGHLQANLDPLGIEPQGGHRRARPGHLRLRRSRLRPADLPRLRAGAGDRDAPRDPGDPAPHLLRQRRRAVHAHLRPDGEGLAAGAHRGQATRRSPSPRRARSPS